jgi:hypothetical protein
VASLSPSLDEDIYHVNILDVRNSPQDYNLLRPFFAWAPADTIQKTLGVTTQYAQGRVSDTLRQHWKSRFSACNVHHRNEAVATDTIFRGTPAVDSVVLRLHNFSLDGPCWLRTYMVSKWIRSLLILLKITSANGELWTNLLAIVLVQRPATASRYPS